MVLSVNALKLGVQSGIRLANKHLPTILQGVGLIGFGVTIYEACTGTLKAEQLLNEATEEKGEELSKGEKAEIIVKTCWKAFLIGLITIGFFCAGHKISLKRQAALAATYAMTVRDFDEFKAKASQALGETKVEKISSEVAADRVATFDPVVLNNVPGNGPLWVDAWSNTPFRGSLETIRQTINDLNDDIFQAHGRAYFSGEITLNDVYDALAANLNAPQLGKVSWGDSVGFRADLTGPIDITNIRYSKASNGEPCGYIEFKPLPLTENLKDLNY